MQSTDESSTEEETSATTWPRLFPFDALTQANRGGRLTSLCLGLEAWRRGLTVTWTDGDLRNCTISGTDGTVRFLHSLPQTLTSPEDDDRLIDKWETKRILEARGVPVPQGILVTDTGISKQDLDDRMSSLNFPLVIKPHDGTMGRGVFSGIEGPDELRRYFDHVRTTYPKSSILIEEHFTGDDYRVLVIGGRVVAAVKRIAANVTGDGKRTVSQLIAGKNAIRKKNPFLSKGLIRIDLEVESLLEQQGLSRETVPDMGRRVRLRRTANASAGGDVIDATDSLPEGMRQAAIDATAAMPNIHVAGVDFLHDDAGEGRYSIIEMNSRPHIGVHMFPTSGEGRDVPESMIDHFFPSSSRSDRDGDAMLIMDLTSIRRILLSQQADAVTIPPLPEHGFPVRLEWTLPRTVARPFSRLEALRVVRAAAAHGVAGTLSRDSESGAVRAVVAGESRRSCREFIDRSIDLLSRDLGTVRSETLDSPTEWTGPVSIGFVVGDELVH